MKNKVIEKDLELLKAIGLDEEALSLSKDDIALVIDCFDENYYSSRFKTKDTFYCPFAGIPDLGSGLFNDYYSIFQVKTIAETTRLIALMHGRKSLDAIFNWLVRDPDNPSISECVCFKDELSKLDPQNENHNGFKNEVEYLPERDWIERHAKLIFGLAVIFLKEPIKYYKALYSLNKEAFDLTLKKKDDFDFISKNGSMNIEDAYKSILDLEGRGFDPKEVLKDE